MSPSDCVCLQSSPSGTIFWSHKLDVWLQEIQRCGNWSVTTGDFASHTIACMCVGVVVTSSDCSLGCRSEAPLFQYAQHGTRVEGFVSPRPVGRDMYRLLPTRLQQSLPSTSYMVWFTGIHCTFHSMSNACSPLSWSEHSMRKYVHVPWQCLPVVATPNSIFQCIVCTWHKFKSTKQTYLHFLQ